jgi:cytoskeletal protein CcmA (bactofilin family)
LNGYSRRTHSVAGDSRVLVDQSQVTDRRNELGGVSCLPEGCEIVGDLYFAGPLFIGGRVEGSMVGRDHITIEESGVVNAEQIVAPSVTVAGALKVRAMASSRVELLATAKTTGDLFAPVLSIHEGAQFEGLVRR